MSAPGTPKASPAAVAAVQEALGCERYEFQIDRHFYCRVHDREWTERGCPVAVAAADAAAPHNAATALREAADDLKFPSKGAPYEIWAAGTSGWLHGRADRIEASRG